MATDKEERRRKAISMASAPSVVVSGYLTKRTRSMNRWVKRWWQLLDNGSLIYFKTDDRVKMLAEIDIGRACYDVRLGAQHCKVAFPRAIAPGSCFAVSVLKRTYYLFAPSPAEAKQWTEHITALSAVLNRRQRASRQAPKPPVTAGSPVRPRSTSAGSNSAERAQQRARRVAPAARHSVAIVTPSDKHKLDQEQRDEPSDLPVFRPRKPLPPQESLSLSQPATSSSPMPQQQVPQVYTRYRHGSLPSLDQLGLYSYPYSSAGGEFSPISNQSAVTAGVVLRTRARNRLQRARMDSIGSVDEGHMSSQSSDLNLRGRERSRSDPKKHKSSSDLQSSGSHTESPFSQSHPSPAANTSYRQSLPGPMIPQSYRQLGIELQRLQEKEAALRKRLAQMDHPREHTSIGSSNRHSSLPFFPRPPSSRSNHSGLSMHSSAESPSSSDVGSSTDPSPQIPRRGTGGSKDVAGLPRPILKRPLGGYTTAKVTPLVPSSDCSEATDGTVMNISSVASQGPVSPPVGDLAPPPVGVLAPPPACDEHSDTMPATAGTDISDFSSVSGGDASQHSQISHSPTSSNKPSPTHVTSPRRRSANPPPLPSFPPPPLPPSPRHQTSPVPRQNGVLPSDSLRYSGDQSSLCMSRDVSNRNHLETLMNQPGLQNGENMV